MRALLVALAVAAGCSLSSSAIAPGSDGGPGDSATDSGLDAFVTDTTVPPGDGAPADVSPSDSMASDAPIADAAPDAGLRDYYDIDWQRPSAIPNTVDTDYCETDAATTGDMRWLYFTRSTSDRDCYADRRIHVMAWNDGTPGSPSGVLPVFDSGSAPETNVHPMGGAAAGRAGDVLLFHVAVPGGGRDIHAEWLRTDAMGRPMVPDGSPLEISAVNTADAESDPTVSADGSELIFTRFGDLYSVRGTPPDSYGAPTLISELSTGDNELDPALSPDGRVIAFARQGGDQDIYVARRRDPAGPFEPPTHLSRGPMEINHTSDELDCFITADGDLLFTTDRDGSTRLWRAPLRSP